TARQEGGVSFRQLQTSAFLSSVLLWANLKLSPPLKKGRRRPRAERGSSVGGPLARRRGVWCQDQLRLVDDVADITVIADEADPAFRPLQPHQVAGLPRLRILPD